MIGGLFLVRQRPSYGCVLSDLRVMSQGAVRVRAELHVEGQVLPQPVYPPPRRYVGIADDVCRYATGTLVNINQTSFNSLTEMVRLFESPHPDMQCVLTEYVERLDEGLVGVVVLLLMLMMMTMMMMMMMMIIMIMMMIDVDVVVFVLLLMLLFFSSSFFLTGVASLTKGVDATEAVEAPAEYMNLAQLHSRMSSSEAVCVLCFSLYVPMHDSMSASELTPLTQPIARHPIRCHIEACRCEGRSPPCPPSLAPCVQVHAHQ
jgi:hypothetical protein